MNKKISSYHLKVLLNNLKIRSDEFSAYTWYNDSTVAGTCDARTTTVCVKITS